MSQNELLLRAIVAGTVGTSIMTLFSTFMSHSKKEQFKEHEILKSLLCILPISSRTRNISAWLGHYSVGIAFALLNTKIQKKEKITPSILAGSGIGLADSIVGISIWKIIFMLHPNPPKINLNEYLIHLIIAHIIFGTFSNLTLKATLNNSSKIK